MDTLMWADSGGTLTADSGLTVSFLCSLPSFISPAHVCHSSLFLFFPTHLPITPLSSSHPSSASLFLSLTAANKKQQPLDAAVLYLFSPHCQLLCAQHVCGRGGGKLPQVSPAAGGGRSPDKGGEAAKAAGEKEEKWEIKFLPFKAILCFSDVFPFYRRFSPVKLSFYSNWWDCTQMLGAFHFRFTGSLLKA